jgi:hypothetical protein
MGRQQATLQNLKSIGAAALVGLGLVILMERVDGPVAQVDSILSCVAREAMALVPYVVPAAWRALQSYVFDHQGFSPCHLQMLVSCWSLLQVVAGAA